MYKVTAYRKIAILDKNLKFSHRWVKVASYLWETKSLAIRSMRSWTDLSWLKATVQKIK